MTVFAACLFALAAFTSAWAIAASWRRYGSGVRALRAQLAACPDNTAIRWRAVFRPGPSLTAVRMAPTARRARRAAPALARPALGLAA